MKQKLLDLCQKLPADYYAKVLLHFGANYVVKSPIALFDRTAARDYVSTAWSPASSAPAPSRRTSSACSAKR